MTKLCFQQIFTSTLGPDISCTRLWKLFQEEKFTVFGSERDPWVSVEAHWMSMATYIAERIFGCQKLRSWIVIPEGKETMKALTHWRLPQLGIILRHAQIGSKTVK
eukprot:scaffold7064_cov111-Cylindrotheca_fusiformis.AAC.6